jgi:vacuolar-type H+-ATPase subunit I/STV1
MKFTDNVFVPLYVWFTLGFGIIAIAFGAINFVVNIWTLLTVKGFYIATWQIVLFAIGIFSLCIFLGWSFEHYKMWDRIVSHQNQNMNPEIRATHADVLLIKKHLNIEDE